MNEYGKVMRSERVRAGLSQSEVAERVGVDQRTVSNYERGITNVPADVLLKLSDIYGCTTDWLLGITDTRTREVVR